MPDPNEFIDTTITCPSVDFIQPDAQIIQGVTHTGKPCRIVDNTASVSLAELQEVLTTLIREKRFGLSGLSAKGGNSISLNAPTCSHIQFGDKLYRMLLFSYEARIEPF